jgi:hypothetical protein
MKSYRKDWHSWEGVLEYLDDSFIERPADDYDRGYNRAIRNITRYIQHLVANEVRPVLRDEKVWEEVTETVAIGQSCDHCGIRDTCSARQRAGGSCVEAWDDWLSQRLRPEKADERGSSLRGEREYGDG